MKTLRRCCVRPDLLQRPPVRPLLSASASPPPFERIPLLPVSALILGFGVDQGRDDDDRNLAKRRFQRSDLFQDLDACFFWRVYPISLQHNIQQDQLGVEIDDLFEDLVHSFGGPLSPIFSSARLYLAAVEASSSTIRIRGRNGFIAHSSRPTSMGFRSENSFLELSFDSCAAPVRFDVATNNKQPQPESTLLGVLNGINKRAT